MDLKPALSTAGDLFLKHLKYVFLVAMLVVAFICHQVSVHKLQSQVVSWQNAAAQKDKTVEEQKGVYEKLAVQTADAMSLLDTKDQQIAGLQTQIKQAGEKLDNAVSVGLTWKQAYEGAANATQTTPAPTKPGEVVVNGRIRVDFSKDFGYLGVSGYTMTTPPEAWISVKNLRPLKLTVALSQSKDGAWHSYATSSEDNVSADIIVAAVNPSLRDEHWYERIGFVGDLGLGDGFLGG